MEGTANAEAEPSQFAKLPENLKKLFNSECGLFVFVSTQDEQVKASCKFCLKTISAGVKASSNFLQHLKTVHKAEHKAYVDNKESQSSSRKRKATVAFKNQPTLDVFKIGETFGQQEKFDRILAKFVVSTLVPISIVGNPTFLELIQFLQSDRKLTVPHRAALRKKIILFNEDSKLRIKNNLHKLDFDCATADCWSTKSKRFLGVTVHWLTDELTRESRVLTFCRFKGDHTGETIARLLHSVFQRFGLDSSKIVNVVTDNGSNFVKAFKDYGIEENALDSVVHDDDDDDVEPCSETVGEDHITHISVTDILNEPVEDDDIRLPKHSRCVAHTMSLIGSQQPGKISDRKLMHSTFGKCSALWTRSSSPKAAETILEIGGKSIIRPVVTRWNSKYDAVCRLLELTESLAAICTKLELPIFKQNEIDFLIAYQAALGPLCSALDTLQGEKNIYLADVMPEILRIEKLLQSDAIQTNKWAKLIAEKVMDGINQRFKSLINFESEADEFIIASISHPFFKTRWIPACKLASCKDKFLSVAIATAKENNIKAEEKSAADKMSQKAKRFDFQSERATEMSSDIRQSLVELECAKYYNEEGDELKVLDLYPLIKRIFRKYNTQIPSSAPVERLFSYTGMIMNPKRNRMGDDILEAIAMLKCNQAL